MTSRRENLFFPLAIATSFYSCIALQGATTLVGDHIVVPKTSVTPAQAGNLTVAADFATGGGIDFGALPTSGLYGVMMTYDKVNRAALLDLTEINGSFLWRQNTLSATPLSKMTLSATNSLSLFKTDGSAAGIVFDPNAGAITLTNLNSGIFFGTNTTPTLKAASNGSAIFPNSVTLQGTSGVLKLEGTAESTSSTTGALTVVGGLGVGKDAYFFGVRVGRGEGNAISNTVMGNAALSVNSTGLRNSAFGNSALRDSTTGSYNSAFGNSALYANTTGGYNSATGANALRFNTTGILNSAIGAHALYANTTGGYNSAIGASALFANTTGSSNVAVGSSAGRYQANGSTLTDPENSVYIGENSRGKDNTDDNSIVIGANAIGEGANTTVIGNSSTLKTRLHGDLETIAIQAPSAPGAKLTLKGQVEIEAPQGDISMGAYQ